MQSSHTCHVNKTTNFKTLTVLRLVTLRSGYCRIMFFSARRRERLGRGTGGRWMTCVTAGTATATGARVCGVKTHSSSSLSDSESVTSGRDDGDCWPAASMVLVASRGRRWCWWLAGVVSCGTATSVVLVASRGRRWCWWLAGSSVVVPRHRWCWWLAGSSVVVPSVGGVGGWPSSSGLSAAVWAVVTQPAVVSGRSAHPALAAPKL